MVSVSEFFKHKIKSEQQADFQIPVNFELLVFFYFSPFLIFFRVCFSLVLFPVEYTYTRVVGTILCFTSISRHHHALMQY